MTPMATRSTQRMLGTCMPDRVVIDASAALAAVLDEPAGPAVNAAVQAWSVTGIRLLVPTHFWLEVANVLVRRYHGTPGVVTERLVVLDQLGIETIPTDRPMLLLALDAMERFGLSAYDAIYLALAQSTDARLATLDRRLASAAGPQGLLIGSDRPTRLAEEQAAYAASPSPRPTWARSAVVGAHIAELRRRALSGSA
jgi:predicted nucleic acid-binding protein